jgi:hypothetical protein
VAKRETISLPGAKLLSHAPPSGRREGLSSSTGVRNENQKFKNPDELEACGQIVVSHLEKVYGRPKKKPPLMEWLHVWLHKEVSLRLI